MPTTQLSEYARVRYDPDTAHPVTIETRAAAENEYGDLAETILSDEEARRLTKYLVHQFTDAETAQTVIAEL